MTLRSMREIPEHDCDTDKQVDTDICKDCGEHAGFCSVCETSECCGAYPYMAD